MGTVDDAVAGLVMPAHGRVVTVGVDGGDGAGKTTFADALAMALRASGRPVLRVSLDDFHHRRDRRYRLGRDSAEGFLRDSYDLDRFRAFVLDPLAPGGDRRYRPRGHDLLSDELVEPSYETAAANAVLVVDGLFLLRPELADAWDLTVFLRADEAARFARMAVRDGSDPDPGAAANLRYRDGHRLYLERCDPMARADVVVDVTDVEHPVILRGGES